MPESSAPARDRTSRVLTAGGTLRVHDDDGADDLDLLITSTDSPARVLRNEGGERNQRLRVRLAGTTANRDATGAAVRVVSAAGTADAGQAITIQEGKGVVARDPLRAVPAGTR
jgi:hypothetical protein